MSSAAIKTQRKRTASPEQRREQLIKATIRSIARRGLSATTVATVSKEAGLSQGIINLHFQSKDRLLVETLHYLADEYKQYWQKAINGSGERPAEKIAALVSVDFEKVLCQRDKLAVWFAFWGETRSRPTYREICKNRDQLYLDVMIGHCQALIEEGGFHHLNAEVVGNAILAMTEGLWLDLLMSPEYMKPEQALNVVMQHLRAIFPGYFRT